MEKVRFEYGGGQYTAVKVGTVYTLTKWTNGGSTRLTMGKVHTQSKTERGIISASKKRIDVVGRKTGISSARVNAESMFHFGDK